MTYFPCVFTLPDRLSSLVLGNRRQLYALLFNAAWQAIDKSVSSECGIKPAALMVLHTWNQRLGITPMFMQSFLAMVIARWPELEKCTHDSAPAQ